MTGRKRAFGFGPPETSEDQNLAQVDETQAGRALDDVVHQERNALGVIDHSDTRSCRPEAHIPSVPRYLPPPLWSGTAGLGERN